jgi:diadenosine tetraphosphate (Ap4A) HIT family hydrolase
MSGSCGLCDRVKAMAEGKHPAVIREFKHSYWVLGDHQFFKGYSLVLLKKHVREMHELAARERRELLDEVMRAGDAVAKAFKPWKMNFASLGNVDEHVHWHIIPRYKSDPDHRAHPWLNSADFNKYGTSPRQRTAALRRLRLHSRDA